MFKGDVVMGAMYLIENCSDHKSSTFTLLNCIPQCNHPRPWKNCLVDLAYVL